MRRNTTYLDQNYFESAIGDCVHSVLAPLKSDRAKALANGEIARAKLIENQIKAQTERLKKEGFIK